MEQDCPSPVCDTGRGAAIPRNGIAKQSRQRLPTAPAGAAQSAFARSRSVNFCTFPVDVFGSGPNTTVRGVL